MNRHAAWLKAHGSALHGLSNKDVHLAQAQHWPEHYFLCSNLGRASGLEPQAASVPAHPSGKTGIKAAQK